MDIDYIKKNLQEYVEVDSVFDLKQQCLVKYITLHNENEVFSEGGVYNGMGDNCVRIKIDGKSKRIPLVFKHDNGEIYYKTRIFMKEQLIMNRANFDELLEIVESQQQVIDKLCKKIKNYENILEELGFGE